MCHNHKGQNLIEYILLVAAVVFVCIIFLKREGPMEKRMHGTLKTVDQSIQALDGEFAFDGKTPKGLHSK